MRFQFVQVPGVPKLAWLAEVRRGSPFTRVLHGEWIETWDTGFLEGCWAGDFAQREFDSKFMTGTGAKVHGGSITFVAPNHTLDRLCTLQEGETLFVSNSLPFVLAAARQTLDDEFLCYDSYFSSIREGIRSYERSIPASNGRSVQFHYFCNLIIDEDLDTSVECKIMSPQFNDYHAYREFLDTTIGLVARNARDERRRIRYAPMSTISRGYDSPAATVIAKKCGCQEVATFKESRRGEPGEDCGSPIARALGLRSIEFDRLGYRSTEEFSEIRSSGGPSEFLSFGCQFSGCLLFTGFNGDMVWDKHAKFSSSDLVRADSSGAGLTEYRIYVGFCHLPVAFVGADSQKSIRAISNSVEMKPWSIGGNYDRPIARRIVEDAGVDRRMFGQRKRAAGVVVTSEGLVATMSDKSLSDFNRFVSVRWNRKVHFIMGWLRLVKLTVSANERLRRLSDRVLRVMGVRGHIVPMLVSRRWRMLTFGYVGKASMLFHWGTSKLIERYHAAIESQLK